MVRLPRSDHHCTFRMQAFFFGAGIAEPSYVRRRGAVEKTPAGVRLVQVGRSFHHPERGRGGGKMAAGEKLVRR